MRYTEMTPEEREQLLDDPDNYPLRVSFLGKVGLLSLEAIALLREHEVDFDVDDGQAAAVLGPEATIARSGAAARAVSIASWVISVLLVAWSLLRGRGRPSSEP